MKRRVPLWLKHNHIKFILANFRDVAPEFLIHELEKKNCMGWYNLTREELRIFIADVEQRIQAIKGGSENSNISKITASTFQSGEFDDLELMEKMIALLEELKSVYCCDVKKRKSYWITLCSYTLIIFATFFIIFTIAPHVVPFVKTFFVPSQSRIGQKQEIANSANKLSYKCVIFIEDSFKQIGSNIPNLAPGGNSLGPLRPIGTMVYQILPSIAEINFTNVEVVTSLEKIKDSDLLIKVNKCRVLKELYHTNFRIRGLPMLAGYVDMYASVKLDITVLLPNGKNGFSASVVGKSDSIERVVLFPLFQFRKMMTERLDSAVYFACKNAIVEIIEKVKRLE